MAWLLVLAGPLGWIGLLVIAAVRSGGERLTVTLPFCEPAHEQMKRATHTRSRATFVFVAALAVAFLSLLARTTDGRLLALALAVAAVGALGVIVVESFRPDRATVRLSLDASRRWVTLYRVHPDFERALAPWNHDSEGTRPP